MACISAALSVMGISAAGGLLRGGGLLSAIPGVGSALSAAGGGVLGSALSSVGNFNSLVIPGAAGFGDIASVASGLGITDIQGGIMSELSGLSEAVSGALEVAGSSLGGGALTGAISSSFPSLSGVGFIPSLTSHASELFGANPLQMVQTFGAAESFSNISESIAGALVDAGNLNFGANLSALTKVLPVDGDFGNFLGGAIPDMTAMVTNGLSSLTNLVDDLPLLAGDLTNLGSAFNINDIANFGNPGQLVNNIVKSGAGSITGITQALAEVGIDPRQIPNLASSEFNDVLNRALSTITDPKLIANAQAMLGSNIQGLESMADFMDFERVMKASFDSVPFDRFDQFAEVLQDVNLGSLAVPADLGGVLNALDIPDLPNLNLATSPVEPGALNEMVSTFLGGSGTNGAVTTSDIIGTIGGVGVKAASETYTAAMNFLNDEGKLDTIKDIYSEIQTGLTTADYHDDPLLENATQITDPRDSSVHTDLDSFITNKISQLESAVSSVLADTSVSGATGELTSAWNTMHKKVYDEKNFAARTDLQLDIRNNLKENGYYFASNLPTRAESADKLSIIEGMAEAARSGGDGYGEYWQAYVSEVKNKMVLDNYNVKWRAEYQEET